MRTFLSKIMSSTSRISQKFWLKKYININDPSRLKDDLFSTSCNRPFRHYFRHLGLGDKQPFSKMDINLYKISENRCIDPKLVPEMFSGRENRFWPQILIIFKFPCNVLRSKIIENSQNCYIIAGFYIYTDINGHIDEFHAYGMPRDPDKDGLTKTDHSLCETITKRNRYVS